MSEVVELAEHVMSRGAAQSITERIRRTGAELWTEIVRAFRGRAWQALGYATWDEYCDKEFEGAQIRLPREQRTMIIGSLADAGMSTRAIAAATGVNRETVRQELAGGNFLPPAVDPDAGIVDADIVENDQASRPEAPPERVTGLDGKSYPKSDRSRDAVASRVARVRDLAASGHTSRQIASDLGLGFERVRQMCTQHSIEIPADSIVGKSRRIDPERVVETTVSTLTALVQGLDLIEGQIRPLDAEKRQEWLQSLAPALKAINRLKKELEG